MRSGCISSMRRAGRRCGGSNDVGWLKLVAFNCALARIENTLLRLGTFSQAKAGALLAILEKLTHDSRKYHTPEAEAPMVRFEGVVMNH